MYIWAIITMAIKEKSRTDHQLYGSFQESLPRGLNKKAITSMKDKCVDLKE